MCRGDEERCSAMEEISLVQARGNASLHSASSQGSVDEPSASLQRGTERKDQVGFAMKPLIRVAVLALVGAATLFAVFRPVAGASGEADGTTNFALRFGVYCSFQENMLFTVVLVDSLEFMQNLGFGAEWSGSLIGIHKMGTSMGTIFMFMGNRIKPDLWRNSGPILWLGACLQVAASLAFCGIGIAALSYRTQQQPLELLLILLLLLARFLQGLGGGLQISLAFNQAAHLLAGSERATQNMRLFLGGCLGLGAGPLLSSAAMPPSFDMDFTGMLMLAAALPLMQLTVLLRLDVPSLKDVPHVGEPKMSVATLDRGYWSRVAVVFMCLCMQMLRNLALAALEAGVSAILQTEYGWSRGMVGVGTTAIVFAALPFQLLFEQLKSAMSSQAWTILMLWVSVGAACFMQMHSEEVLLGTSSFLFPMMALSSGLIMAKMQDNVMPQGSLLDLNTATLLGVVMADFMGRGGGPVLARWSTSRHRQHGLAWIEMSTCAVTALLYHVSQLLSE